MFTACKKSKGLEVAKFFNSSDFIRESERRIVVDVRAYENEKKSDKSKKMPGNVTPIFSKLWKKTHFLL